MNKIVESSCYSLAFVALLLLLFMPINSFAVTVDINLLQNNAVFNNTTDQLSEALNVSGSNGYQSLNPGNHDATYGKTMFSGNTFTISGTIEGNPYTVSGTYQFITLDASGAEFSVVTTSTDGLDAFYGLDDNSSGYLHIYFTGGEITSAHLTLNSPVPIPAAGWLMGTGILVFFGLRKKNKI